MTVTAARPALTGQPAPRRLRLVAGGAALFVLVVVWIVAFSPVLGVRTVTVSGTRTLSADQVRTAARIGHGAPLIRLDTAAVRKRIAALPDVADVSVGVTYPSTVRIRVTERVPVGYLVNGASSASSGSSYVLVDSSGAQYREVTTEPAGLPRFTLPAGPTAQPTGRAVSVVAAALEPAVLAQLAQISADTPQAITLVLRDGRTVAWGSAERSPQKAALLPALLGQPGRHFDVSNPDLAIAR